MKNINFILYSTVAVVVSMVHLLPASSIGSDSAVNRFGTQQVITNNKRVAGFAALDGGFWLANEATVGTFDSFFPVSGNIVLNGGTLLLNKNLSIETPSALSLTGIINGAGHALIFDSSITNLPLIFPNPPSCNLEFVTSVTPSAALINSIDWNYDSRFLISLASAVIAGNNTFIYEFNGENLVLKKSAGQNLPFFNSGSIANAVRWHPSRNVFAVGQNKTNVLNSQVGTFGFDDQSNTITQLSSAPNLFRNVSAVSWNPLGSFLAAGTEYAPGFASRILVYNVNNSGAITSLAASATTMSAFGARSVQRNALDWDSTGTFIAAGVQSVGTSRELLVYKFTPPSTLEYDSSFYFGGATAFAVAWHPLLNYLAVAVNKPTGNTVCLYEHTAGSLIPINSAVIGNLGAAACTLSWNPSGDALLVGCNVHDGVDLVATYCFDLDALTLSLVSSFSDNTTTNVRDISWAQNGNWVAAANKINHLDVYDVLPFVPDDSCLTLINTTLVLNGDLTLDTCLKLVGNSSIEGHGNSMTLGANGLLIIDADAHVLMNDVFIRGLKNDKLVFAHANSSLQLINVTLGFDGDYAMSQGLIIIKGPTTTILKNHTWSIANQAAMVVNGVTLWKDPAGAALSGDIVFAQPTEAHLALQDQGAIKFVTGSDSAHTIPLLQSEIEVLQEQVAGLDSSLQSCCDMLGADVNALQSQVTQLNVAIAIVQSDVGELETSDAQLDQKIQSCGDILNIDVNTMHTQLNEINSTMNVLQSNLNVVEVDNVLLDQKIQSCADMLTVDIDVLQAQVNQLDAKTQGLQDSVNVLESYDVQLNTKIQSCNDMVIADINALQAHTNQVDEDILVLESEVNEVETINAQLEQKVQSCADMLTAEVHDLQDQINHLNSDVITLQTQIDAVETHNTQLDQKIQSSNDLLVADINVLQSSVNGLVVAIENVQLSSQSCCNALSDEIASLQEEVAGLL